MKPVSFASGKYIIQAARHDVSQGGSPIISWFQYVRNVVNGDNFLRSTTEMACVQQTVVSPPSGIVDVHERTWRTQPNVFPVALVRFPSQSRGETSSSA